MLYSPGVPTKGVASARLRSTGVISKRCCWAGQVRGRLTVQSLQGTHRYRGIMHAASVIVREVRTRTVIMLIMLIHC